MISLALIMTNKLTETVIDCMVFNVGAFLEFLLPLPCTIHVPSHWLHSHITIVATMDSVDRENGFCRND